MEFEQAANAVIEEPVTAGNADPTPEPIEQNDPAPSPDPTPQPDITQTQAFSKRLREETARIQQEQDAAAQAKVDKAYENAYSEYGIKSEADYLAYMQRQQMAAEAQQKGIDPAVYEQMNAAQREAAEAKQTAEQALSALHGYKRKEELEQEAVTMAQDPRLGKFFADNKAEIMQLAQGMNGQNLTPQQHLDIATTFVLKNKWQPVDETAIKQKGVDEYLAQVKKQNIPVEGSGGGIPAAQPQSTGNVFKDAQRSAENRLRGKTE